ncbi:Mrp family chromosome partitioning ATPase [Rhodococcus sp. 27YEA15]|uniref:AAA family ATPase n=1 Tax=Rhodococcus sp. 27YEA15 TaxID=3156259 RepID=UPI003C7BC2B3
MRSDNNGSNTGFLRDGSATPQSGGTAASDEEHVRSLRTVTFTPQFDEPSAKPLPSQRMRQSRRDEQADFRSARPQDMTSVDDLDIIKRAKRPPERGFGSVLFKLSGGRINTGQSAAELEHQALVRRANQTVRGVYKIAFISLKGGVGKTTAAKTVGSTFASIRGDRVVAIDANPDLGTLADREEREHHLTVRDLLADSDIKTYSDVRYYTSQGESRLEILASEADPETSESFNEQDYLDTLRILEVHYNIIITDCGTADHAFGDVRNPRRG